MSGAGASSVAPLVKWGLTGTLSLPGALTVVAGGANITGGLTVASGNFSTTGTTTFNGVAYSWPGTSGSNGQFLQTDGSGGLAWAAVTAGVSSVTGTTNQVAASPTTGAVIVSLPSSGTLPGTWHGATGFTVDTGGLTIAAGGLTVTAGGANITGGITGTLNTAAQPNVTSVGTLTSITTSGNISLTAASTKILPGATPLSFRNNADSADNLLIVDAGDITARTKITMPGPLVLTTASSKIIPGATQLSLRNNADSSDNLLITDAGAITVRSTISGVTTLTATTLAGTLSTAAQTNVTSLGSLTGLTVNGTLTMGGTISKGSNALTGSRNASDIYPIIASTSTVPTGVTIWAQPTDPGGSANNGDFWVH